MHQRPPRRGGEPESQARRHGRLLTQVELGDVLGISAVHANRVLQELRATELISWSGTLVRILDWEGLVATGQFDDEFLFRERIPR